MTAGSSTVYGLAVNRFKGAGIELRTRGNNIVWANRIGTNTAGTLDRGNIGAGVLIINSASNMIAFNGRDGVRILGTAVGNKIQRNSLFSNVALGIDLSGNGVTANDTNDADAGPNKLQNFQANISASRSGANLTVTYSVPSTAANSTFTLRVEFYFADTAKQEGKTFLQAASYTSAGRKTITFPAGAASAGSRIVATATDASGNTSEFSASRAVTSPLLALKGEASAPGSQPPTLTSAQLQPIVNAAIARLTSQGLNSAQVQTLSSVKFNIASLSGATLGLAGDTFITLDSNAAGYRWYIDETPGYDSEFGVPNLKSKIANPKLIELLTTVMLELGRVLRDSDLDPQTHLDELVSGTLGTGVLRSSHLNALDSFLARQKRFI